MYKAIVFALLLISALGCLLALLTLEPSGVTNDDRSGPYPIFNRGLTSLQAVSSIAEMPRKLEAIRTADLLMQNGLRRLADNADDAFQCYELLETKLRQGVIPPDKSPMPAYDRYQALLALAFNIDDAILKTTSSSNIDKLVEVRRRLSASLSNQQSLIITAIEDPINSIKAIDGSERPTASWYRSNFDPILDLFSLARSSISELENARLKRELVSKLIHAIQPALASDENLINSLRNSSNGKILPAKNEGEGVCHQILINLEGLFSLIELAEHDFGDQQGTNESKDGDDPGRLDVVRERVESLVIQISDLRSKRYNLWALNEIMNAESAPDWELRLGRLDEQLLLPLVNNFLGRVTDTLLQQKGSTEEKAMAINRILQQNKIRLSVF